MRALSIAFMIIATILFVSCGILLSPEELEQRQGRVVTSTNNSTDTTSRGLSTSSNNSTASDPREEEFVDNFPTYGDDSRIILTPYNIDEYNSAPGACDHVFDSSAPTGRMEYGSLTEKIAVRIPFSMAWADEEFLLLGYESTSNDAIYFGPLFVADDCSWKRAYSLEFLGQNASAPTGSSVSINGIDAIRYQTQSGNCTQPSFWLSGPNGSYRFSAVCSQNVNSDFSILEDTIATMRFL